MPQVPSVGNINTGVSAAPTATIINTQDQSSQFAAKQTSDLGAAFQSTGKDMTTVATDMAERANQLRVDDAMNQMKEASMKLAYDKDIGYTNLKGKNALDRPDGKSLADEYSDRLRQDMSTVEASLGTDAQRRAFQMNSNNLLTQFRGQVTQHEGAQFKDYSASVRQGTIKNRQNEIALNYDKPEVVNEAVGSIKAASYDLAVNQLGKSGEEADAFARDSVSGAHKLAIMTALQNGNVTYANGYFAKYSKDDQMNGDDILAVRGQLNTQMDATIATGASAKATEKYMGAFQPNDMDRLTNIVLKQESGGREYDKDGGVLTSSKGAQGSMQVMPGTQKDPGYGVVAAKDDSPEERARVGRDYLKAMVGKFGDVTKALAAYNAGPGDAKKGTGVEGAVAKATAAGNPDAWLSYLPKETQDYATNGTKRFNAGSGQTSMPTEYEYVQTALGQLPEGSRMETVKATRETATAQYKTLTESVKQKGDQAVADAIREMQSNGGNFALLSPQVRAAIPPEKVDTVRQAGVNTITNPAVYMELANNPQRILAMTDDQFLALRGELSVSDWQTFAKQRGGVGEKSPESFNSSALNTVLSSRLREMGLNPEPKAGDSNTSASQQVYGIRKFMEQAVLNEQTIKGRQLTDQETNQVVDRALALQTPYQSFWGGTKMLPAAAEGIGGIPRATKDALKQQFKDRGVTNPSDADILAAYLRGLAQNQPKKGATNG